MKIDNCFNDKVNSKISCNYNVTTIIQTCLKQGMQKIIFCIP